MEMKGLLALRASPPETRYAQSGDVSVAYQVAGSGPPDLVVTPGFLSHLEQNWLYPAAAQFLEQLASFARLIIFDKRGTGLSDRSVGVPSARERMDDLRAVMDAAGSPRAVLMGISEGGSLSALFAATYPKRTSALILYGAIARGSWAPDYPWSGKTEDCISWWIEWKRQWGGPANIETWAPSMAANDRFRHWYARYLRMAASPDAVRNLICMNTSVDVREVLPAVGIPTLILHRRGDRAVGVEHGRYLAAHIPGAEYVELEGEDHLWYLGDVESIVAEVRRFVHGGRRGAQPESAVRDLSAREIEIAVLLTQRLSTAEIADRLFISPRTVSKHLEHIYLKLNANRRRDARRILLAGNQSIAADAFW